jgi:hypothetical protein
MNYQIDGSAEIARAESAREVGAGMKRATAAETRAHGVEQAHRAEWGPEPRAWESAMTQADWEIEARIMEHQDYESFLTRKTKRAIASGFDPGEMSPHLFEWQRRVVALACRHGRYALFEDCGLGKTIQQLEWARLVRLFTGLPVLVLAPLAVGRQTEREAAKFGIDGARYVRAPSNDSIQIANYEIVDRFDPERFGGIVLDESSILKAIDGKTRMALTDFAASIPYRLCATATPAPNDHMELGNHAEFLGVMTSTEMLATFFCHDGGETSKWRLKGHARKEFWRWVCSWAVAIQKPSDVGGDDDGFILPPLNLHQVTVASKSDGIHLFSMEAKTLDERRAARRASLADRVAATAALVAQEPGEQWLIWCDLNAESEALATAIPRAVEVRGSDRPEDKESRLLGFTTGDPHHLDSKPSIAAWGMNYQHCARTAFVGLSDSFEQFYQAVRRVWRFGQTRAVEAYVVTSEAEGAVVRNIERKQRQAEEMMSEMVSAMAEQHELSARQRGEDDDKRDRAAGESWELRLGDCVEESRTLADQSIDFSIFSPPFASLYTYTDSPRDMGNCSDDEEFFMHFRYLVGELFRVTKPGRLCSFHCMDLPLTKMRDGEIGLRDFRGLLIRAFEDAGWIYHSAVTIWKDPATAMQRTKALGLLWKQIKKDSSMSRQGIADYLVTMRKPGVNPEPIKHTAEEFPVDQWQKWASPVWMDINPSETLQYRSARAEEDERHICPLQLEVIRRAIYLWSNPNDLVLSPFAGIGSEGHEALKAGRRFIGFELKPSYFDQARRNLEWIERHGKSQQSLFSTES